MVRFGWLAGDYKLEDDQLSVPYEPVKCHHFISECTFGLPVYHWPDQNEVYEKINDWWKQNKSRCHFDPVRIFFGKITANHKEYRSHIGPVYVHKTVGAMNDAIICDGADLPETITMTPDQETEKVKGNLIIAPPSFTSGPMVRDLAPFSSCHGFRMDSDRKKYGQHGPGFCAI
jgi:putative mRNA 3-end processing factor